MPGMGRSVQTGNSLIVSTFHTTLFHQLLDHPLGRRPLRHRLQHRADGPVPQIEAAWPGFISLRATVPCARTRSAAGPPHRIRLPVDPRRAAPAPVGDAPGPSVERDPACGQHLAGVGAARRQQRREHLVQSPDSGGVGDRLDPGRTRSLVARRATRQVVAAGRSGQRRLGSRRLGLRRGVRWHLRSGCDVAVRHPGRCPLLLRRGHLDRPARTRLRHAAPRPDHPGRGWCLPHRHGAVAGMARPGVLAGARRHAGGHGARDGEDAPARFPLLVARILRFLRRRPRMGRQPLCRRGPGRHRSSAGERAASIRPRRPERPGGVQPRRLGADRGSGVPRGGRHGPQFHAADGTVVHRWLRGHGPSPSRNRGPGRKRRRRGLTGGNALPCRM